LLHHLVKKATTAFGYQKYICECIRHTQWAKSSKEQPEDYVYVNSALKIQYQTAFSAILPTG